MQIIPAPRPLPAGSRPLEEYVASADILMGEAVRLSALAPSARKVLATVLPGMIPGVLRTGGNIMAAKEMRPSGHPTAFAVIFPEDVVHYPGVMPSTFFVTPLGHMVFRYADAWHLWYAATIFTHECSHRADVITGRERLGVPSNSVEFNLGEVRAHTVEDEIVNAVTEGVWHKEIEAVLQNPNETCTTRSGRVRLPNDLGLRRLLAAMPAVATLSGEELAHRKATANMAVVLAQFDGDRKKVKAYIEFSQECRERK